MKALTVKQPWASLIIDGYKKYEFRSWKTNYRGKIYIHAGKSKEKNIFTKYDKYNLDYQFGAIIGEAEIVDCILVTEEFFKELNNIDSIIYGNKNNIGIYAWKLNNVKKYDVPIKINGQLGLWNYQKTDV